MKSYNSTLTVIDQGTPTMTKTITVNDPLVYKGIWFYQSSYGDAWDQIEAARINIKDKANDKILATVDLEWNKEKAVDGLPLKMKMTISWPISRSTRRRRKFSKTAEHANPAIRLAVDERSSVQSTPWVFIIIRISLRSKTPRISLNSSGISPRSSPGCRLPGIPASTWSGLGVRC